MSTSEQAGVLRSSALMAAGTITSRATGLIRDMALVAAIGFGTLADTYSLGNSLPNIIYILVAGGALNAVFIPQLVRHMNNDEDGGHGFANRLLRVVTLITLALTIAAVLAAPWIVQLYATSEYSAREFDLALAFARLCLPQIVFYGLYTMFAQVLNARGHFGSPMFAPIVNNVVVIGAAIAFLRVAGDTVDVYSITDGEVAWLGIMTTLGVALQALVLIPVLLRSGFRFAYVKGLRGFGLGHTGKLAIWTIGLVLVNQLGFLVVTRLATLANVLASRADVVAQGLTTYQKAFLIFMLPHSVITISIMTALLPRMSRSAAEQDFAKVGAFVADGMRLVGVLIVPAAVCLGVAGPMIAGVIFGFGAGSGAASSYAGLVVMAFAVGLLPFSLFYVLLRGWYSLEDTKTPFYLTVVYNVLMVGVSLPLFYWAAVEFKVTALALGYSVAYWFTFGLAWMVLNRRLGHLQARQTAWVLGRLLIAGAVAGVVGFGVNLAFTAFVSNLQDEVVPLGFVGMPGWALVATLLTCSVAVLVYVVVARLLRVREISQAWSLVSEKLPLGRRG
ncbi:MAG: murein biosynthesis integral membrane protein MurJ [Actinobacteria bacterium]|jgi:putative peptidoglycan lipid II flippase|nr:murein biosynthesis integral membrane protein MurJ [Actinomycetota bacterium]MCO5299959.1 murein biosynthesis integral membrane protein MurJ [Candidatus Nanopelagicales bacterium]MCB9429779.1 murein biosynthesis integral membrane protein MurJ [Actinomycetota bacterium]HPE11940.1 murein biosynthesis integral membrane protein MurJ [Actinomycetota bacterium]HPJ18389.1 murein biosynthesis integral membrane protein MurJ [Actinomycetota bacterium]